MTQRKTQSSIYWQEQFIIDADDIEYLYSLLLEQNRPQLTDSLAMAVVQRHCRQEEMAIRAELQRGTLYQPRESYKDGEQWGESASFEDRDLPNLMKAAADAHTWIYEQKRNASVTERIE